MDLKVAKCLGLHGTVRVPGDKSVSHRALILGALAEGETLVRGFLPARDCLSTASCLQSLGVEIRQEGPTTVRVAGAGKAGLAEPEDVLDAGNSGTTIRLLLGVLAGCPFYAVLTGDRSLRRRPMGRVVEPLTLMGARIWGREGGRLAPLSILGNRELRPLEYRLPVASAQLKSALLLAGLKAGGVTSVWEPSPSRDHTERLLTSFGAEITREEAWVRVKGPARLQGREVEVPGDFSAAAFFTVAGLLVPGSRVYLTGVGINPTRTGLLDVLLEMGAEIKVDSVRQLGEEPVADLEVRACGLRAVEVGGTLIPRLIDEVPILAVAATQAEGVTVIRDAAELAVKESNRLEAMARELSRLGADVKATPDGLIIRGPTRLHGTVCDSHGDHRVAMAVAVAGLVAEGETVIREADCIAVSFPDFARELARLSGGEAYCRQG
ncbi:MAG: 3-phosphoshikimate 1-carboxyvinyltransferase [Clostridia bacterium]|jgi:3-phosphoshikimate 1-carboxyvinyltransferase|nr:3-phosphoshikimate 1-carboxyvinyltransferase [Clostridia bacterium]MDH7572335.1 3-phosphoshikimate 1-carboxyvinyltransferase [Clostridia bacterium]